MSQLTIKLSDKADALIAQLQKEIFNRRRKKVSASGVVETLVESGAKSQSDKRFATSWKNLISDIEKAAKLANAHGSKPANLSDAEWALVLSHRARSTGTAKSAAKPAAKRAAKAPAARKPAAKKAPAPAKAAAASKPAAKAKPKPAKAARNPVKKTAAKGTAVKAAAKAKPASARSSVARRMAKAVSRLNTSAPAAVSSNGAGQLTTVS
ncbi:MAG: hypothetical protein RLZZ54_1391 [Cyanobacteriota bacterium]|jgi:ATP-dependent Clp protease ATP-binding subunit ClpA